MTASKLKGRSPLKGASLLDEFEKDRIKSQTDIISVITSYGISLEKKGSSLYGAVSPFMRTRILPFQWISPRACFTVSAVGPAEMCLIL